MSLPELLRLALSRLRTSRMRSALTMLGVVIGVAAVVALVGVGQGTTSNITQRLSALGTNLLTVNPGAARTGNTVGAAGSRTNLTTADAAAIGALPSIAGVEPEVTTQALVVAGTSNSTTSIVGTTPDYLQVRAFEIAQGSFLPDVSVEQRLRVAVLGATTATDLGLGASAVGSPITIGGLSFQLIGILQPKGGAGFQNPDDQVIVPISVVQKYFVGGLSVRTIGVSVASPDEMTAATTAIGSLLRRERHNLAATAADDFTIFNQTQLLDAASSISTTLTLLLGGIASISLVVGGIGIMNIMLVSVRSGPARSASARPSALGPGTSWPSSSSRPWPCRCWAAWWGSCWAWPRRHSSPGSPAGRSWSAQPRWSWLPDSAPPWASSSVSGRHARRPSSTRSPRCATNNPKETWR